MQQQRWGCKQMEIEIHHTICIGPVAHLDPDRLKQQAGVDLYFVSGGDVQEQISMALLDHFHCYRTVVFVGGGESRREAQACGVTWIEDMPSVNEHLLEFWRTTAPECDGP
jgi:hypothetical protein